jgi:hypothetical protein
MLGGMDGDLTGFDIDGHILKWGGEGERITALSSCVGEKGEGFFREMAQRVQGPPVPFLACPAHTYL